MTVQPNGALVGETVIFTSMGSFDPDMGPSALKFDWSFDDGVTASGAELSRTFSAPGAVRVTLTVSDGEDTAVVDSNVLVLDVRAPGKSVTSGPLALAGPSLLWVANTDSNSVTRVDVASFETKEFAVGLRPTALAWDESRALLFVTCSGSAALWVLTADGVVVRQVETGPSPTAVVVAPVSGRVLVTEQAVGSLLVLEAGGGSAVTRLALSADPAAIAVSPDGQTAFVSHFITRSAAATISVIDLTRLERRTVLSDPDAGVADSGVGGGSADAGGTQDAGSLTTDAGDPLSGGFDASVTADAGNRDAGRSDAGAGIETPDGAVGRDGGTGPSGVGNVAGGCGCGSLQGLGGLVAMALLVARRRRPQPG